MLQLTSKTNGLRILSWQVYEIIYVPSNLFKFISYLSFLPTICHSHKELLVVFSLAILLNKFFLNNSLSDYSSELTLGPVLHGPEDPVLIS